VDQLKLGGARNILVAKLSRRGFFGNQIEFKETRNINLLLRDWCAPPCFYCTLCDGFGNYIFSMLIGLSKSIVPRFFFLYLL